MNNVALNSNEIDLVFNNCECININVCTIENLQFEVESEQFINLCQEKSHALAW